MLYEEATWKEIQAFVEASAPAPAVIVPIGCLEEHGPHLPVGTDNVLAMDFAKALVEMKGMKLMVGPLVSMGVAVLTRGFPGTVKVRFDTLRSMMVDLLRSLVEWGFRKVFLWTWHGGSSHEIALREAAIQVLEELGQRFPLEKGTATRDGGAGGKVGGDAGNANGSGKGAGPALVSPGETGIYILRGVKMFDDDAFKERLRAVLESVPEHGGELETSLVMYLHPGMVRENLLVREYPGTPRYRVLTGGRPYLENGLVGDATVASKEKGEKIFGLILDELARHIRELMENG